MYGLIGAFVSLEVFPCLVANCSLNRARESCKNSTNRAFPLSGNKKENCDTVISPISTRGAYYFKFRRRQGALNRGERSFILSQIVA